ncbi:hypothetical protein RHMOL_Rhmol10G0242900 [Rhododendron molle]|uniref:Uncharacterized protein n=1 Tax=Rhododendron molle TaxID=49168 RepID=A0ACC0M5L0_RHOML|nr:hypothetical protein RHMOL_Rhmol10G0242900 [Rhododendron molle]
MSQERLNGLGILSIDKELVTQLDYGDLISTFAVKVREDKFSKNKFRVDHWSKFSEAVEHGNLIPLYRSIPSGHLTPETAYRCLVKEDEIDAPSFLFESVEPGLQQVSQRTIYESNFKNKS